MDPRTGREFSFTNPQDDPEMYPPPPEGFAYDLDSSLVPIPNYKTSTPKSDNINETTDK